MSSNTWLAIHTGWPSPTAAYSRCTRGQVTFRWRDSADGNQQKLRTLDAIEFIRRFLLHILPPGFVKIRHFGFLAHPHRRSALLLAQKLLRAPVFPPPWPDAPPEAREHRCP